MKNIKITIAYDGTHYLGWQKTAMGPSIEAELEKTVSQIVQHDVKLQAASRTDAGVHAEQQIVNFFTSSGLTLDRLKKSVNSLLPTDISVIALEEASPTFHPTLDAKGKEYLYSICLERVQLPFHRHFSWHCPGPIDLVQLQAAAPFFIGEHDFSALTNAAHPPPAHHIRTITDIEIEKIDNRLKIRVSGNSFLYKMVRNIVGTLIDCGKGKIDPTTIPSILESRQRVRAGVTAPAHGLTLRKVFYD